MFSRLIASNKEDLQKTIDDEIGSLRKDYYECLIREAELKIKIVELEEKVVELLRRTSIH
tara:strand:+ start:3263 stop:3442 length:180 start_codon:yes stop_codon:yes gene_type:complete